MTWAPLVYAYDIEGSEPNVPEYVGKNTRIVIYSVYAVILINWLMVDWAIAFTQID